MKIYHVDLENPIQMEEQITACIGYFDGLHLGHQKLIEKVVSDANIHHTTPSLITFEPDPWTILKHIKDIPHITPMKQRIEIGEKLGIKNWIILNFKQEMADLSIQDFHEKVLLPLRLHTLVCGYDFHYATRGSGSVTTLKQQTNFQVDVVEEVSSEHQKISSTRIEELLRSGNISKANQFMGRVYELRGKVIKGRQVGSENGFPTANIALEENYIIPKKGVYIGKVKVQGRLYSAILNIGNNPTYNYQEHVSIEAHLLEFHENIYEEEVSFFFCEYIREEKKFKNVLALGEQLTRDVCSAKDYFKKRREVDICD
ncbi:MAG: bifunctional riboflavin kinase/FAD synthetase [Longicatena sp.]